MAAQSDSERCARSREHRAVHQAFECGNLQELRTALGDPPDFPNAPIPFALAVGEFCLEYAIYWSPIAFIRELLEAGANPNYDDHTGFPSLIAALERDRPDRHEVLALLLSARADTGQRGINDLTPLHYAVMKRDLRAIELLLEFGADPHSRTRIDDCSTPLEDARKMQFTKAVEILERQQ